MNCVGGRAWLALLLWTAAPARAAGKILPNGEGSFGLVSASSGSKQVAASSPFWNARLILNGTALLHSGFLSFLFGGSTQTVAQAGAATTRVINPAAGPVSVTFPAGSLAHGTTITLRVPDSVPSSGRFDFNLVPNTAVEILSSRQPDRPVSFVFSYANADIEGFKPSKFVAARFDEATETWVTLFSSVDPIAKTVSAQVKHFSLFAIGQLTAADSVSTVKAAPNPFRPSLGHTTVTIYNVPAFSRIRILTLGGQKVRELMANASGMASWDARNEFGQKAASGVYYGFVESGGAKKTFKVGVER